MDDHRKLQETNTHFTVTIQCYCQLVASVRLSRASFPSIAALICDICELQWWLTSSVLGSGPRLAQVEVVFAWNLFSAILELAQ